MFVTKRARQVTNGWRLGITGIDNVENQMSLFYGEKAKQIEHQK